jgi:hypothetical protein
MGANQRHGATDSAKKPQKKIAGAKKRQSASLRAFFVATLTTGVRAVRSRKSFGSEQLFGGQNR